MKLDTVQVERKDGAAIVRFKRCFRLPARASTWHASAMGFHSTVGGSGRCSAGQTSHPLDGKDTGGLADFITAPGATESKAFD